MTLERLRQDLIEIYTKDPHYVREHFGIEEVVLGGGYAYRQVTELIQNAADAILEAEEASGKKTCGRIEVRLTDHHLYVANTGAPLSEEGVVALLHSHSSPKRQNQIGRFGIGFKSLLKLGGRVDILSRPICMRFDPERTRIAVREALRLSPNTPVAGLRMAWELDAVREQQDDPILREMDWATTVVRAEIVNPNLLEHLQTEMGEFPAEFMLFFQADAKMNLIGQDGACREISRQTKTTLVHLLDNGEDSRWRLFSRRVRVEDEDAKEDATHIHQRDEVPITWAVPMDREDEMPEDFWSFFPTDTSSSLPGILNAPWKLNDSRTSLVPGEWNTALMEFAAELVADSLPSLNDKKDACKCLDAFPEFKEPWQTWPDFTDPLVDGIIRQIVQRPFLANAKGEHVQPQALFRPPPGMEAELYERWLALVDEGTMERQVSPSALKNKKRVGVLDKFAQAKYNISGMPSLASLSMDFALEAISNSTVERTLEVLAFVAKLHASRPANLDLSTPKILLTVDMQLCAAKDAILAPAEYQVPTKKNLHPALWQDKQSGAVLEKCFGLKPYGDQDWEKVLEENINQPEGFWRIALAAPREISERFMGKNESRLKFRRVDGTWTYCYEVLLPGECVNHNDFLNRHVLIDTNFHAEIKTLIPKELLTDTIPFWVSRNRNISDHNLDKYSNLDDWFRKGKIAYLSHLRDINHPKTPQSGMISVKSFVIPLWKDLFLSLEGQSRSEATLFLLQNVCSDRELSDEVIFQHRTTDSYPKMRFVSPAVWLLAHHGTLNLSGVNVPLSCLGTFVDEDFFEAILGDLDSEDFKRILVHAPHCSMTKLRQFTASIVRYLLQPTNFDVSWWESLLAFTDSHSVYPESILRDNREISRKNVHVSDNRFLVEEALELGIHALWITPPHLASWHAAGYPLLSNAVSFQYEPGERDSMHLADLFPELGTEVDLTADGGLIARFVRSLQKSISDQCSVVPCVREGNVLYLDEQAFLSFPHREQLRNVLHALGGASVIRRGDGIESVLDRLDHQKREKLFRDIAAAGTLEERLLLALGGTAAALRRLPLLEGLEDIDGDLEDKKIAQVAIRVYGPVLLSTLKEELANQGLNPPMRWGTSEARQFVEALGFPAAFADAEEKKRDPEMWVSGPSPLPELHDFQKNVLAKLDVLFKQDTPRRRAVVSLPTGSGKTRVTVEAAVRFILVPAEGKRLVLWVAQTDELCEQAVQSFRQVWHNRGARHTDLRIIRLWGGHSNPWSPPDASEPTVVVSSIQTLNSRCGQTTLAWLAKPGILIIDECHHATAPSYTGLLSWVMRDKPEGEREPPLLGLSATPFRGTGDNYESRWLANRFGGILLPEDQEGLYEMLLDRKVLAQTNAMPLPTGAEVRNELRGKISEAFRVAEPSLKGVDLDNLFEEINEELADNVDRNKLIVQRIIKLGEKQVLFFSNTKAHALEIALRLNLAGVHAAAVSGDTPGSARRYFIEEFQAKRIKVLCNHSVLTTGFDAPQTDVVFIARQVYSAVRYMQMVGRGLRGRANGGKDVCLLLTLVDNLGRFNDHQPYKICQPYFTNSIS